MYLATVAALDALTLKAPATRILCAPSHEAIFDEFALTTRAIAATE